LYSFILVFLRVFCGLSTLYNRQCKCRLTHRQTTARVNILFQCRCFTTTEVDTRYFSKWDVYGLTIGVYSYYANWRGNYGPHIPLYTPEEILIYIHYRRQSSHIFRCVLKLDYTGCPRRKGQYSERS
jgi:hypothetical protein